MNVHLQGEGRHQFGAGHTLGNLLAQLAPGFCEPPAVCPLQRALVLQFTIMLGYRDQVAPILLARVLAPKWFACLSTEVDARSSRS